MEHIMSKAELKQLAQSIITKGSDMSAQDWFEYESAKLFLRQATVEAKAADGKRHGLAQMGVKLVESATAFKEAELTKPAIAMAWAMARQDLKKYMPKAKPFNKVAAELAAQLNEGLEEDEKVITLHECKMALIKAKEAAQAVVRDRDKAAKAAKEAEKAANELLPKFEEARKLTEYNEAVHGALISQLDAEAYALLGTKNCMSDEFYEEAKRYLIFEFMLIHSISMMDGVDLGANAEKISDVPIIALPSEIIKARFAPMAAAQAAAKAAIKEEALRQSNSTAELYAATGKAKAQALFEFYSNPSNKGVNANELEESVAFDALNKAIIDKAPDEVKTEIEALNAVAMEERSMHRDTFHKKMYLLPPCPYGDDKQFGYWEEIWRILTPVRYINALSYENSRQQIAAKHSGTNERRKKNLADMYPEEAEAERQEWLKGDRESHLNSEGVRTNDKDDDAITSIVHSVAEALKTRWVFYNAAIDDSGDIEAFLLNHGLTTFATIVEFNKALLQAGATAKAQLEKGQKLDKSEYGVHSVYGLPFGRASLVKALWELMSNSTISPTQFEQLCDKEGDVEDYTNAFNNEKAHEEYTLSLYRVGVRKLQWELSALSPYARKPWKYTFNNGTIVDVSCMQELISCIKVDLEVPPASKVSVKVNAYAPLQNRPAFGYFVEHIQRVKGDFDALRELNKKIGINTLELSETVIQKLIQVLGKSADVQRGLMYMVDNYLYESPEKHKIDLRNKDGESTDMLKAWTRVITTLCDKFIAARAKRQAVVKQLLAENGYLLPEEATAKEKRELDLAEAMAWLPWATEVAKAAMMQSLSLEGIVLSIPISEEVDEELTPEPVQAAAYEPEDDSEFYCLDL